MIVFTILGIGLVTLLALIGLVCVIAFLSLGFQAEADKPWRTPCTCTRPTTGRPATSRSASTRPGFTSSATAAAAEKK